MQGGMMAGNSGGGPTDPYFANVVSLLNFGGADGSTTFTDAKGRIWTPHGAAEIDTSLGYNAGLFPGGTNDYIETPEDAALTMAGDFTIDFILRISSMTLGGIMANSATSFGFGDWAIVLNHAVNPNKLSFFARDVSAGAIVASNALSVDTDYHIEISRGGGNYRIFQGGTLANSAGASAPSIQLSRLGLRIGRYWNGASPVRIIASRITAGVCRHTSNFTPPTAPFPTA